MIEEKRQAKRGLKIILGFSFAALIGTAFLLTPKARTVVLEGQEKNIGVSDDRLAGSISDKAVANSDIEPQKPLSPPPAVVKGVYLTSWSAGSTKKIDEIIRLIKETELNAVVIDLKDYSGLVTYDSQVPDVLRYGAREIRIKNLNSLIKKLHDNDIYIIARITVFQDPVLAAARPESAVHSKKKLAAKPLSGFSSSSTLWLDNKKLAWIDPGSREVWDYVINIGREAVQRGIDELNFDYIRFPSDGNLEDMVFPSWKKEVPKHEAMEDFFSYLRRALAEARISADIFGMTLVKKDDMGIGQLVEDTYENFDFINPMVYPSHYYSGFLGYKKPAEHPYEVIKYSMEKAVARLLQLNAEHSSSSLPDSRAKIRPWVQSFDLGAKYTDKMVREELRGITDGVRAMPEATDGFLVWDPANNYRRGSFLEE